MFSWSYTPQALCTGWKYVLETGLLCLQHGLLYSCEQLDIQILVPEAAVNDGQMGILMVDLARFRPCCNGCWLTTTVRSWHCNPGRCLRTSEWMVARA